jgi:hypothetical protein
LDAASAAEGMTDMRGVAAALLALTLAAPGTPATRPLPSQASQTVDIAGGWILNHELTTVPQRGEMDREAGGGPRGGGGGYGPGGGRGGGFGGGMGRGGFGGGMGRPSDEEMRKMEVVRRRLTDVPDRLIVVRDAQSVSITDGNGRRTNYKLDGKKQDQFNGDGEFTTKTRFDGNRLIVEEDFGRRKLVTTYSPILDGDKARLEVTVKPEGGKEPGAGRGGMDRPSGDATNSPPREFKRVYDLEARGQRGYFF